VGCAVCTLQHESSKERIIALIDADRSMLGTFTDDVSMQSILVLQACLFADNCHAYSQQP
jgi:hypothetical protein